MEDLPKTAAFLTEKQQLPAELRPHYDELVKWYRHLATVHCNHPFVSYKILADLIREGWRLSAPAIPR